MDKKVAGYILSGGKNTRMNGEKKLFLTYEGKTFGERIKNACKGLSAIYLSVDKAESYEQAGLPMIEDHWQGIGPMGGICSGLRECREEALFVMACDMPMIEESAVQQLLNVYNEQPGLVVASAGGRVHPLFGIYPKLVLPLMEKMIEEKNYRIMGFLDRAGGRVVELSSSRALENVNTPAAYRNLSKRGFVFAISGYKNSGKTTMVTRLIPELTERGYKVAVIKHDGHDFESDVPGTDSYRHQKAGAYGTAVFSANRILITKECQGVDETQLFQAFPEADIILIEGLKNSSYPKYFCRYPEEPLIEPEVLADEIEKLMRVKD